MAKKTRTKGTAALLSDLLDQAADTSPATKGDRPEIYCAGADGLAIERFAAADALLKVATAGQTEAKAQAHAILRRRWLAICVEQGKRPANPRVLAVEAEANYVVKHVAKLPAKEQSLEQQLADRGFAPEVAKRIRAEVLDVRTSLALRPLDKLASGTPAEKAVATKLMQLLKDHLSPEQRALVLEKCQETTVAEKWQDLAIELALERSESEPDAAAEQLDQLYQVIGPQFVLQNMVYRGEWAEAFGRLQKALPELRTAA